MNTRRIAEMLGLSITLSTMYALLPAVAETVVEETTTYSSPIAPIVQTQTKTVEQRTVTTPATVIYTTPALVGSTTVIEHTGLPNYRMRLSLMQDQIDSGLAKGWITAYQASSLRDRVANLMGMADALNAQGFNASLSDSIERQATTLNIVITDALQNGSTTASTPVYMP